MSSPKTPSLPLILALFSVFLTTVGAQLNITPSPEGYVPPQVNGGSPFVKDISGDLGMEPLNVRIIHHQFYSVR